MLPKNPGGLVKVLTVFSVEKLTVFRLARFLSGHKAELELISIFQDFALCLSIWYNCKLMERPQMLQ